MPLTPTERSRNLRARKRDELRLLREERNRLRGALEFYADEERWREFRLDEYAAAYDRNTGSDLKHDEGDIARNALKETTHEEL